MCVCMAVVLCPNTWWLEYIVLGLLMIWFPGVLLGSVILKGSAHSNGLLDLFCFQRTCYKSTFTPMDFAFSFLGDIY